MTPVKEIGECLISIGCDDYFFRPSFTNMTKIGEPSEIVKTFYDLHNDEATPLLQRAINAYGEIPPWLIQYINGHQLSRPAVMAAMSVLTACCDKDLTPLIGEIVPGRTGKWTFVYRRGAIPVVDMLLIAQSLITHGIIGKAKIRHLQRHESGKATTEFKAFEYISAARNHFNMPRKEAEQLSMTEFQLMLAAKYPDQKGLTRDEYDAVADDYLAKKARKLINNK
jgi:hypothetical protein